MHRQRFSGRAHLFLKGLRKLHGAAFGLDERQVAIVGSDAGYQTPYKGGGARRKFLEQRLVRERGCAVRRNIRKDSVLSRRQPDFAVAVCFRERSEFVELLGIDSSSRHAETHGQKAGLFLRGQSDMVGVMRTSHVSSAKGEFITHARGEFGP